MKTAPQPPGQRLGRVMVFVAWALLLLLLTLGFNRWLERQYNPNPRPASQPRNGGVEVVLRRNRAGHYVAGGAINGHPVVFLLDTGATQVAVPESLAQSLRLPRGPVQRIRTANGLVNAWSTRLERVSLGGIELTQVRANILPGPAMGQEVLLGMSFLRDLELVQRDGWLTLRQP